VELKRSCCRTKLRSLCKHTPEGDDKMKALVKVLAGLRIVISAMRSFISAFEMLEVSRNSSRKSELLRAVMSTMAFWTLN